MAETWRLFRKYYLPAATLAEGGKLVN